MSLRGIIKRLVYRMRGDYTVEQLVHMGLTLGERFNPQLGVSLDPSHCWLISIGDDVTMAPNVQVLAHDASTCQALGYAKIGRVTIGNRVFVGAGSIILPGVTIGDDVIVGAGSVITHDIPSGMVFAGNPAREIIPTQAYIDKHREKMKHQPVYDDRYTLRKNVSDAMKAEQKQALEHQSGYLQ